jgi:hypothetical protein
MRSIEWEGTPGGSLQGANVRIDACTVVELATLDEYPPYGWGVWGIRIDGSLYREPRDLDPEPLGDGPFCRWVEHECEGAARALAKTQQQQEGNV